MKKFWCTSLHFVLPVLLLPALYGCRSLEIQQLGPVSEEDWTTLGAGPLRGHATEFSIDAPLQEVWSYNATAAFGPGSALLVDDVVIVANQKGEVHAIDFETGKRLGVKSFGDAIEGTPVVDKGILYVPVAWQGSAIQAYQLKTGNVLWKTKHAPVEASLLMYGGSLIAADVDGTVRAFNPLTGVVKWEHSLGERVSVMASPLGFEEAVVVADVQGKITAFQVNDGSVIWTAELDEPIYETPGGNGTTMYVPTTRGSLISLDVETGKEIWRYEVPDSLVSFTSPAATDQEIVVGGSDGILRVLEPATGKTKWMFSVDEAFTSAPFISRNTIYIGSMGQKLYALDRSSGRLVWEQEMGGRIKSALAGREGRLVVLAEPRTVYMFESKADRYAATP